LEAEEVNVCGPVVVELKMKIENWLPGRAQSQILGTADNILQVALSATVNARL
jgi:hypothetical protein